MGSTDKKRLWIFIAAAYGITILLSGFMYLCKKNGQDTTIFVNAQMFYPATGVILGRIIAKKPEEKLPMATYITILVTTFVMIMLSVISTFVHVAPMQIPSGLNGETTEYDFWNIASQYVIILGSIASYVMIWCSSRERRAWAGLERKNIKLSIWIIALFIVLYFGRAFASGLISDAVTGSKTNVNEFIDLWKAPITYITLITLPVNFFFSYLAFFGEEYGWRYYLQPIMQKKFGLRLGVVLLGLVWGLWHWDADFMFYTPKDGIQMFATQFVTCISMAIFFGWAYMKTKNIWVPVIMHYLNNNMILIFTGGDANALSQQEISWSQLPIMIVQSLIFVVFILMPIFNKSHKEEVLAVEAIIPDPHGNKNGQMGVASSSMNVTDANYFNNNEHHEEN